MTAFFDTILPAVVVAQLFTEGVNLQILRYLRQLYDSVQACIRTAAGVSRFKHMWPGFRQGGRFSTTAGKTTIRRLIHKIRDFLDPVYWGYQCEAISHLDWADDVLFLADSQRSLEQLGVRACSGATDCGTGINNKTEC